MNIIFDYDTYIFDFDGVIVDSEKYHWLSYQKATESEMSYEEYCKVNHGITGPYFRDSLPRESVDKKDVYYREYINEIPLIPGVEEFYKNLLHHGKDVIIVTNSTQDIFNLFAERFSFLKTISVISGLNKPSTHGFPVYKNAIAFEDSYRGYHAASQMSASIVFVNSRDYVYFDTIRPLNHVENFVNMSHFTVKYNTDTLPFYMSSKTHHKDKWLKLKEQGFNITSNWITNSTHKDDMTIQEKEQLCQEFLNDIKKSDFGIFYSEHDDTDLFGALIEFGMLTSFNKPIYIMGHHKFENEVFYHMSPLVNYDYVNEYNVAKNIMQIYTKKSSTPLVSSPVESVKPLDYVAIVASGEGSRLLPLTKHIPKLLVAYNNKSILQSTVEYWKTYTRKFIIVIQSKYNTLVNFYMNMCGVEYEIINVNVSKGQENSYTIHSAFKSGKFDGKRVLMTWCDIYPSSLLNPSVFSDKNIIFTYKNYGRYDAVNNILVKKAFGNVIGIYYFPQFKNIEKFIDTMDICDCYTDNFDTFETHEFEQLIDIGDMNKLDSLVYGSSRCVTRYFNSLVEAEPGKLLKSSTCPYGDKIINDEMRFYKFHSTCQNIPRIYKYLNNSFEMEKITGNTVHDVMKTMSYNNQCNLIRQVIKTVEKLHETKVASDKNQRFTDTDIEFRTKVNDRIENVKPLLDQFGFIRSVNGIDIVHTVDIIKANLYKKIQSCLSDEYCTIHGDPHFSNMIKGDKVYFIDPRGYFGKTKLFGPAEYDIGKLVYSLSGFDYFNNDEKFAFYIDGTNISIQMNNNMDAFIHLFHNYDKDLLVAMTILHWFGLADYCKTNIHKCISAYYYAIYMYHLKVYID